MSIPGAPESEGAGLRSEATAATHFRRGREFRKAGAIQEAIEELRQAVASQPEKPENHVELGLTLLAGRQSVRAIQAFKRAFALAPDLTVARLGLALAYVGQNDFERAWPLLCDATDNDLRSPRVVMALGRCHRYRGNMADALDCFRRVVKSLPDSATAHYEVGCAASAAGGFDEAEQHLRRATQLNPKHVESYFELGCILLNQQQRFQESMFCNESVLELQPTHYGAGINLAACLLNLQRPAEAEPLLQQAIATNPTDPIPRCLLGHAHLNRKRFVQAMDLFESALRLSSQDADVLWLLHETGERHGDREHLLARLRRLQPVYRRWGLFWAVLGRTLHDLARLDEACSAYDRARRLGFRERWIYVNCCHAYCRANNPAAGARVIRQALARWPNDVEFTYHLGMMYVGQHQPAPALAILRRVVAKVPDHVEANYTIGELLMQRGHRYYGRAAAALLRTLELNPRHPDALWNMAAICHSRRRIDAARAFLARAEAAGCRDPRLTQFKRNLGMA